jgi:hypothetical protein
MQIADEDSAIKVKLVDSQTELKVQLLFGLKRLQPIEFCLVMLQDLLVLQRAL